MRRAGRGPLAARHGSRPFLIALVAVLLVAQAASGSTPVEAKPRVPYVDTAGAPVAVRVEPSHTSRRIRLLADETPVTIVCQTRGDRTSGTFGTSNLWDKLSTGGYVSDTYVFTGSDKQVARSCPRSGSGGGGSAKPRVPYVDTAGAPVAVRVKPSHD